ncbi:STAS domain-containing protein [Catenulispora subtropica]|uniref:STAS domain-containing protein n=1 Tax=Catenulispora subtropica TaxID=450798 RepID=UPI0031DEE227
MVRCRDGRQVVKLRGDFDLAVADDVRAALQRQIASGAVLVDCSDVDFIDSRGLSALICARYSAVKAAVSFQLLDVPERMHRTMRAAGIDDLFALATG